MSLSLQESCQLYERHARRQKKMLSFAEFNRQHFTCLPADVEVESAFKTSVTKTGKAHGWPIRGRLMSLYRRLTKSGVDEVASSTSAVVSTAQKSFVHEQPKYSKAMRMKIRAPEAVEPEEVTPEEWTLEGYVDAVQRSELKESKGLMVHFVPQKKGEPLSSLASKLTKTTWEAIRGKCESSVIKMKDGSQMDLSECEMDADDVKQFVRNRKKKVEGPYFIRFSRI